MTRQHIWIVRYGLTHPPLVEGEGPFDMDIEPVEGVDHSKRIAAKIAASVNETKAIRVFTSPFLRTAHTANIIAKELSSDETPISVCIEEGLTEWLTSSLVSNTSTGERTFPRPKKELAIELDRINVAYQSVNSPCDENKELTNLATGDYGLPQSAPRFPESEDDLLTRCRTTIERLLSANPGADMIIVSHAPCIQAIAYALEGAMTTEQSTLKPWPLGGITKFSRDLSGGSQEEKKDDRSWSMDMYGNTEHMPGNYQRGLKAWSLPCFAHNN